MMTNREIVNAYLAHKKRRRIPGEKEDNTLPLMPFFIMDACYQIYCRSIKKLDVKYRAKQMKRLWADSYHKFTTDFFKAFNEDQTDYIVDMMDEFNTYIHNNMAMLQSAIVEYFNDDTPFETKKTISALMACNVLSQAAQHMYGEMYRTGNFSKEICPYIEGVKRASYEMANLFPTSSNIDLSSSDKVMNMVDALCKKIVYFLKKKEESNANQDKESHPKSN